MAHHVNGQAQALDYLYGKCRTVDGAYNLAWQQWEDRETAVENAKGAMLRADARVAQANGTIRLRTRTIRLLTQKITELQQVDGAQGIDVEERLIELEEKLLTARTEQAEAAADVVCAEAFREQNIRCYDKAVEERAFILNLQNNLLPRCEFRDLWLLAPDRASEQAQAKEWAYEWCGRFTAMVATRGTIDYDHLESAMANPYYNSIILPHIKTIRDIVQANNGMPLPDALLVAPLNIRHLLTELAPELAVAELTADERAYILAQGSHREHLQAQHVPIPVNPVDLHPALRRTDEVLSLPMNATKADLDQHQQKHRAATEQLLAATLTSSLASEPLSLPQ